MERAGVDQRTLARRLGIREPTVSEWFSKSSYPSGKIMVKLPGVLQADGHWLLTGEGSPAGRQMTVAEAALQQVFAVVDRAREMGLHRPVTDRQPVKFTDPIPMSKSGSTKKK